MDITNLLLAFTLIGIKWVLYLLLFLSVFSIAVMIDRYIFFRRQSREADPFLDELSQHLERGEIQPARELAQQRGGFEGRVGSTGLDNIHRERAVLQEKLTGARVAERKKMMRYLPFLGTLGNNAPFIGLFGTVLGIIRAFHDLAISQVGGRP